nr:MAG TPA: hypothetical protein [Caudoviricetes sp.]
MFIQWGWDWLYIVSHEASHMMILSILHSSYTKI